MIRAAAFHMKQLEDPRGIDMKWCYCPAHINGNISGATIRVSAAIQPRHKHWRWEDLFECLCLGCTNVYSCSRYVPYINIPQLLTPCLAALLTHPST
jgi:hypothetical protein